MLWKGKEMNQNKADPALSTDLSREEQADKRIEKNEKGGLWNNKLLWTVISILIAGISIWAVVSQQKEVSFRLLAAQLMQANPGWLLASVVSMLGFIVSEAWAVRIICRSFGYHPGMHNTCAYSATDIYFSAITPSATGGQPACALLMMKDGISGTVATVALLLNLTMYTFSILLIGFVCFVFRPQLFFEFGPVARVMIVMGYTAQILFSVFLFLLVKNERLLQKICRAALRIPAKLHLIRHVEEKQEKLDQIMREYRRCSEMLAGSGVLLFKVFLLNFMQRVSQISVTMFVSAALGIGGLSMLDVWILQGYVVLGSNYVPVPGGMGVVDYLMLDAFDACMTAQQAVNLELVSRSVSFYCCILLCGAAMLWYYGYQRRKKKKASQ